MNSKKNEIFFSSLATSGVIENSFGKSIWSTFDLSRLEILWYIFTEYIFNRSL